MNDPIPEPLHGADVISWAQPVTRALNALRDKVGAKARNERDRRPSRQPLPFEVRWDGSLNNSSGGWKIYLPTEHLLTYGGVDVATSDISGATVIQDDDNNDTPWFSLDDVDTSADHVWLVVTVAKSGEDTSGETPSGEDHAGEVTVEAEFSAEEGQEQSGTQVHNICVAEISYAAPPSEGVPATVAVKQSLVGALHLGGEGESVDEVSIDRNGGDDKDDLQIAHFNDAEKDSGKGLATRLKADTETGEITSDDKELMLLGRKNGEIIYVPLTGNGKDPSPGDPSSHDPCDHDPGGGSAGGVTPDSDESHGGGGIGAPSQGGVPAEGEPHKGDDDCNCE